MWNGFKKMLKLTNLTKGWTTKIMRGQWKFDKKLKNWTWLHMMIFSCRIMKKHGSFDSEMSFMRFGWRCVFSIHGEKCVSWNSMKEKVLKLMKIILCVEKNNEKFEYSYLETFFSLDQLRWNGKSWKLKLNPLFSRKSQVKLSLLGSSHSLLS